MAGTSELRSWTERFTAALMQKRGVFGKGNFRAPCSAGQRTTKGPAANSRAGNLTRVETPHVGLCRVSSLRAASSGAAVNEVRVFAFGFSFRASSSLARAAA